MQVRRSWLPIAVMTLLLLATAVFVRRQLARDNDLTDAGQMETRQAEAKKDLSSVQLSASPVLPSNPDGLEFERTVVPDAPFSATLITESHQRMRDGSVTTKTTTSLIYRDSKGRTRRDWLAEPASSADIEPKRSIINDPVAGFSYRLDHRAALVRRTVFFGVPPRSSTGAENVSKQAPREQRLPMPSSFSGDHSLRAGSASGGAPATKIESLGIRDMEGVLVEGTRISFNLPTATAGDQQAVEILAERWYAPSLQTVILVKRADPRAGESVYRLTDVSRSEPAAALFIVPAEYKIHDEMGREISATKRP